MKKLATTFGLLALMLIVTSFTTPSKTGGRMPGGINVASETGGRMPGGINIAYETGGRMPGGIN